MRSAGQYNPPRDRAVTLHDPQHCPSAATRVASQRVRGTGLRFNARLSWGSSGAGGVRLPEESRIFWRRVGDIDVKGTCDPEKNTIIGSPSLLKRFISSIRLFHEDR